MIAVAFVALVVLIIAFKMMRAVMSGCMKLVVMAILLGAVAGAFFYFRTHIVLL